jgi:GT2 family glycosyltransferase
MEPDPAELQRRLNTRIAELSAAHKRIEQMREELAALTELRRKLKTVRQERDALKASAEYRLGRKLIQPFRKLFRKLFRSVAPKEPGVASANEAAPKRISYHEWRQTRLPSPARLLEMREESRQFASSPLISIVMPVYNTPPLVLEEAIESVRSQAYEKWELIAVDDASTEPHVRPLLARLSAKDPRIIVRSLEANSGIAMASNAALAVAQGEFVAFLDHDDSLEPDALFEMARRIIDHPDADFIYSDEDKVDESGYFQQPFFKSDWDPDALLSCNYLCHFTAIRRSLVAEIGGFRADFDGAQDYDLFLRATERARRILHIPQVLYHWRISAQSTAHRAAKKPAAITNGEKAVGDAIRRRGLDATVEPGLSGARYRVRYRIQAAKKISILIPTRDRIDLLSRCIETLEANTDWPAYEIIILDNDSADPAAVRYLSQTKHRVVKFEGPFNFAAICNLGVRESDGEWVLFLNNDTEFTDPGWLTAMAEHVQRPEVGAVGAMLLFPSGLVQHGGVVLTERDVAAHTYLNFPPDSMENGGQLQMIRAYSAVTGACMLVRRAVFQEIGGFDEKDLAVSYNDVDFCLRLRGRGYSIIYTPHARLLHHESASRGYKRGNPNEARLIRERWAAMVARDPFNNPNLIRQEGNYGPLARYE